MRRLPLLTLLLLSTTLAGCETLGLTTPAPPDFSLDTGPICPSTGVLSDAVTVTKLKPGTQAALSNPANIAFTAEMSQAKLDCNYDRAQNKLSVDISFAVKATRGPAAMGPDPQLDFFVAIVDADNNVISKNVYHGQPSMAGRATNIYTQNVGNFPVPLGMDKRPYDVEILTGFQLTPDELAYNRVPKTLQPLLQDLVFKLQIDEAWPGNGDIREQARVAQPRGDLLRDGSGVCLREFRRTQRPIALELRKIGAV